MNTTTPRSLRALYLTLALLLAGYMMLDTAYTRTAEARSSDGLSACGSEAAPCTLAPVLVQAPPARDHLAATTTHRLTLRARS